MTMTLSGDGTIGGLAAGGLPDNTIGTNDIVDAAVTPAKISQKPTLGTAVASTSGTSIDFTGIPSWVKRITVMFTGVSTNGSSPPQIQIGAGSVTTSGYLGSNTVAGASTLSSALFTTGFGIGVSTGNWAAAVVFNGQYILSLQTGNSWVCSGMVGTSNAGATYYGSGSITLGGTLDRIRITTANGTDTFDAGSINILYE